ncbi:MAG: thermonuclease family protein [Deltaproteobacteria bacterium]|nr:thermonuclease family protein [Deltaproteobacteria bacterium]
MKYFFLFLSFLFLSQFASGCHNEKDSPDTNHIKKKNKFAKKRIKKSHKKRKKLKRKNHKKKSVSFGKIRISGRVVHVVDADTIHILTDGGKIMKCRLDGINSPECHKKKAVTIDGRRSSKCRSDDEAWGFKAYLKAKDLMEGKKVSIECDSDKDKNCITGNYGRSLITVFINKTNINNILVESGNAFSFTKYPSHNRSLYCKSEFQARKSRTGMWSLGKTYKDILSLMSYKTRRWYKKHDELCNIAITMKGKSGI